MNLVFNVVEVDSMEERALPDYWRRISEQIAEKPNHNRAHATLRSRFRQRLLPVLHQRKEITTARHRQIAVELYTLWCGEAEREQNIRALYDAARRRRDNDAL